MDYESKWTWRHVPELREKVDLTDAKATIGA